MNWNQIRQTLKGSRNWQAAPSEFVRALKELMTGPSNSRRTGTAASGQVELLEIRQVLSAANPTATLNPIASSVPADPDLAASSVAEIQPHENTIDVEQDKLNGQPTPANSDSPVVQPNDEVLDDWFQSDFKNESTQANSNRLDTLSNPGLSNSGSAGDVENSPRSANDKSTVDTSNHLTNDDLGEAVANNDDTSLIDIVFEDSDSILDGSLSNTPPIGWNKSTDESPSLSTSTLAPDNSNTQPTAAASASRKPRTVEADSRFVAGQDATPNDVASDIHRHSHHQQWSASKLVRDFVARSMKGPTSTGLRLLAEFHAEQFGPASAETNSTGHEVAQSVTGRSLRSEWRHFEEIYSGLDLFNSPLASSDIADTVSQFTLSFIADGTLPFEVPQFTPDITTANSVQYLPNTSALRVKQLREGLRHQHHSADVSTDVVQHDGTPEFVESENIPRQLKYVVLPRGPPRRQPDTVLRIMDSDAEAHVLQRLRYSIAPRGPSTVTVEMQSPEERSFSGPRVSPEETCRVQLAC